MGIYKPVAWIFTVLCGLLLLSVSTQLSAQQGHGLVVSPEKCILLSDRKTCEIQVKLFWKAEQLDDYCLFRSDQIKPLKCWQNQRAGQLEYLVIAEADLSFQLKTTQDGRIQHSAQLKLFKQAKRLKKRRRNPWSFY